MVQMNSSMSSLMKPTTSNTTDSIELESRERELDSVSIAEQTKEVDLEQNVVSHADNDPEKTIGEKTSEFDVWWNEPADQDPENPMNWTSKKKWLNIAVMSAITFLTPLASAMFAPGIPRVMAEFNSTSNITATFVVSIFVLGFAFGPLVLAPLSELYGRVLIYNVCNVLFVVFTIGCALAQNMEMLMAFRFLGGFAGVATITCGSGTVADLMPTEKRGAAMALWALGPILGPVVSPVAGGYLIEAAGWRWVFWLITIAASVITVLAFFVMEETYPVVLLERKAAKLRKESGNAAYRSRLASTFSPNEVIIQNLVRPWKMFIFSPVVSAMCIYVAVMYGLLYLLFTTFTFVFMDVYNFSTSSAGLAFLGSGVGTLFGLAYVGKLSDFFIQKKMAAGITIQPEHRLPFAITIPAALSLPIGLFIYGWSVQYKVHWIAPQIGTAIIGFGMIAIVMAISTYLVDAFPLHAASVTAANAVLRSVLGALLPLVGLDLYDALGFGWGNSLLGFIALGLAPIPILFAVFGEKLRLRTRVIL